MDALKTMSDTCLKESVPEKKRRELYDNEVHQIRAYENTIILLLIQSKVPAPIHYGLRCPSGYLPPDSGRDCP